MNNLNPMQIMQLIQSGNNPQQLVMQLLEQQAQNNPMAANVLEMAKQNKTPDIEQVVKNIMQTKGLDYNKEVVAFKNLFGLK